MTEKFPVEPVAVPKAVLRAWLKNLEAAATYVEDDESDLAHERVEVVIWDLKERCGIEEADR